MTNIPTIDGVSRKALEQALLAMKRIYQAGYDRILEAGGKCDTPEYMMEGDPTARELRALLDAPATGICRDCFTEQPIGRTCVTCEKIEGERKSVEHQEPVAACNHEWMDMASAPRDGTMLRLLVEFEEHSTEDAAQAPTIGANNFDNDGEDRWQFAGWCWTHDHFVEGKGVPVGWLPMLQDHQAPVALPDGYCIMPRRLTAENGAKALLLGEFKVTVTKECPECAELDDPNEYCEICDGSGEFGQSHTISWDQIKFIYSKAVDGLRLRTYTDPLTFQFRHQSTNELRTVSVTRAEVAEEMADTLFEKLVSQFCECEPVGETNEVECRCDELGEDYERVADADTAGSAV